MVYFIYDRGVRQINNNLGCIVMEKKKDSTVQKVSSRNRNKNKNRNHQIKTREKVLARKEKKQELSNVEQDEVEVKAIVVDTPTRDNVVVVPDRKVVVEDEDDDLNFISINIDEVKFKEDNTDIVNKFSFVDTDRVDNSSDSDLEEFNNYNNVEEISYEPFDQLDREDEEVKTRAVNEKMIPDTTDKVDINARKHFSFESRIVLLLSAIIIAFFIAGIFIFKSVTYASSNSILYDEQGEIDYEVCIADANNQYYSEKCLEEDMDYLSSITERIPVTFDYEVDFNSSVSTTFSYYVVSKVNIYREKQGKVLNTMEEVLVERTAFDINGSEAQFKVDVDVAFNKYKDYVDSYNMKYGINSYAELETNFYVDSGNVIKKVSSISLPLTSEIFSVDVVEAKNEKQNLTLENNSWVGINTSYGMVGIIFVLFGVLGIIRLSRLVFKVMGTTSMYQRKLNKILREYDKYIVISRSDYVIDNSKRLIKVTTFGELLDARNTLEKPIVYVKVNNVKSEFYVEDSESIYKYTLKEADFEGK